jgi:TRAP-type C4-dicarboxylate transport system permease small subunit
MEASISEQSRQPRGLVIFRQALRKLGTLELSIAVVAFAAAVVLNFTQIGLRYSFEKSIWWAQEISLLLMMIAYFFGISCVFRSRQYVDLHFVVERFPPRIQIYLYYVAQLLTTVFCLIVLVYGIHLAPDRLTTYTVILHLPEFFWMLPLLFASTSMIITSLYFTLAVWKAAGRRPGVPLVDLEVTVLVKAEHEY